MSARLTAVCVALASAHVSAQGVVVQKNLSLGLAKAIAEAAQGECKAKGFNTSVAVVDRAVAVRDTKDAGSGPVLLFTGAECDAFTDGVKKGDFDWTSFGHPLLPTPTLGLVSQNWIGTVAGRVGLVEDRWLLYGKLGGGWVQSNAALGFSGVSFHGSNTSSGWLVGAGVEYALANNWSAKIEYNYLDFGKDQVAFDLPAPVGFDVAGTLHQTMHVVKGGLNYRFGY